MGWESDFLQGVFPEYAGSGFNPEAIVRELLTYEISPDKYEMIAGQIAEEREALDILTSLRGDYLSILFGGTEDEVTRAIFSTMRREEKTAVVDQASRTRYRVFYDRLFSICDERIILCELARAREKASDCNLSYHYRFAKDEPAVGLLLASALDPDYWHVAINNADRTWAEKAFAAQMLGHYPSLRHKTFIASSDRILLLGYLLEKVFRNWILENQQQQSDLAEVLAMTAGDLIQSTEIELSQKNAFHPVSKRPILAALFAYACTKKICNHEKADAVGGSSTLSGAMNLNTSFIEFEYRCQEYACALQKTEFDRSVTSAIFEDNWSNVRLFDANNVNQLKRLLVGVISENDVMFSDFALCGLTRALMRTTYEIEEFAKRTEYYNGCADLVEHFNPAPDVLERNRSFSEIFRSHIVRERDKFDSLLMQRNDVSGANNVTGILAGKGYVNDEYLIHFLRLTNSEDELVEQFIEVIRESAVNDGVLSEERKKISSLYHSLMNDYPEVLDASAALLEAPQTWILNNKRRLELELGIDVDELSDLLKKIGDTHRINQIATFFRRILDILQSAGYSNHSDRATALKSALNILCCYHEENIGNVSLFEYVHDTLVSLFGTITQNSPYELCGSFFFNDEWKPNKLGSCREGALLQSEYFELLPEKCQKGKKKGLRDGTYWINYGYGEQNGSKETGDVVIAAMEIAYAMIKRRSTVSVEAAIRKLSETADKQRKNTSAKYLNSIKTKTSRIRVKAEVLGIDLSADEDPMSHLDAIRQAQLNYALSDNQAMRDRARSMQAAIAEYEQIVTAYVDETKEVVKPIEQKIAILKRTRDSLERSIAETRRTLTSDYGEYLTCPGGILVLRTALSADDSKKELVDYLDAMLSIKDANGKPLLECPMANQRGYSKARNSLYKPGQSRIPHVRIDCFPAKRALTRAIYPHVQIQANQIRIGGDCAIDQLNLSDSAIKSSLLNFCMRNEIFCCIRNLVSHREQDSGNSLPVDDDILALAIGIFFPVDLDQFHSAFPNVKSKWRVHSDDGQWKNLDDLLVGKGLLTYL